MLIDLAPGQARLGGSILAQVFGQIGDEAPDVDDPAAIRGLFAALAELRAAGLVLAYHDRSDGGLFVTLAEMAFAGHAGVALDADAIAGVRPTDDGPACSPSLFAEELGAVVQVRDADCSRRSRCLRDHGVDGRVVGRVTEDDDDSRRARRRGSLFAESRVELQRAWSETTWQMQSLRDNPASAQQEYDRILDARRSWHLAGS